MFDFGRAGGGMASAAADFAVLALGIDASRAAAGAAQFTRASQQVQGATEGMAKAMGPLQNAFAATRSGLVALGVGLAGFSLAGFALKAVNAAARYEELDVALRAVGKNAGYSRAALAGYEEQLKTTGISAIESRQQLLKLMQSQLDLNQATKLARAAQDVAVVGMLNSSDAMARMTHGIVSGQTEVLRTIGLNVQFEAGYKRTADQLGKTMSTLTAAEKVQSRFNTAIEAARPLMGLYEASMTSAAKQLRSTTRYVQDLEVEVGAAFSVAYKNLVFGYADALKALAKWVNENEHAFVTFGIKSAGAIESIMAVLPFLIDGVRLLKDLLAGLFHLGAAGFKTLTGDFKGAAESWEKHLKSLTAFGDNLNNSGAQLDAIAGKWERIEQNTKNAVSAYTLYGLNLETVQRRNLEEDGYRPALDRSVAPNGFNPWMGGGLTKLATAPLGPRIPYAGLRPPEVETPDKGAQKAADALKALRASYADLVASFREQSALEQFIEKLAEMRKEAAQVKMPAAEVDKLEQAALRAENARRLADEMEHAKVQAREWKDELNALAAVQLEPLRAAMLALVAAQNAVRDAEAAARRTTRQASVRQAVGVERGDMGRAEGIIAKMQDFDEKQRLMQEFVGQGIDITKATAMAGRIVEANRAAAEATNQVTRNTRDWLGTLADVANVLVGIAAIFRDIPREVQQAAQGFSAVLNGAQQMRDIKGKNNEDVTFGAAIKGEAGGEAFLAALSGVAAVVSGVAMLADALDLFGTKAREQARQMAEAARVFDDSLRAFAQSGDGLSSVQRAIQSLTRDAATLVAQSAAARGQRLDPSVPVDRYVSRAQIDLLRAEGTALRAGAAQAADPFEAVRRGSAYLAMADDITRVFDTLQARIRELAPAVLSALDEDFKSAVGDTVGANVQRATDAYVARLKDLETLLGATAISQDTYAESVAKATTIYTTSIEAINKAERERGEAAQRAAVAFGNDNAARIAAASGNAQAADDIRRQTDYEAELADARAKGYDVTNLLIAQQLELNQLTEQRARAAFASRQDRELDAYVRDVTLNLGSVAGALAAAGAAAATKVRELQDALLNDPSVSAEERAKLVDEEVTRGLKEQAALRAQYRSGFEQQRGALRAELTQNPVEAAAMEGALAMASAMAQMKDLLTAGIITPAEMADIEAMWEEKRARLVELAKEQQRVAAENFAVTLATLTARTTGTRESRFAAFALSETTNVEQQIRAAEKLVESGTITEEMFESFAAMLRGTVAPALLEAAFAAEEAARILRDNLSGLQQQWGVFGADPNQQLSDIQAALGFGGMTADAIRALFTRITPGVELTDAQRTMNEKVAQFFEYFNRAQQFQADQAAAQGAQSAPEYSAPPNIAIRQLGASVVEASGIRTVTEVTATRLVDLSAQQLGVQRRILAAVERGSAAKPTPDLYSGISASTINRALGTQAGDTALLTEGVVS